MSKYQVTWQGHNTSINGSVEADDALKAARSAALFAHAGIRTIRVVADDGVWVACREGCGEIPKWGFWAPLDEAFFD